MTKLPESIRMHAHGLPEGGVLSPKEFLHLGSRAAIDQAFSRLTKSGELLRVSRGIYVAPVLSRFGKRSPSPEKVAQAVAEQSGETLVPHGANSANALGLTQQVPTREVFLSSGRTRNLTLGRSMVTIKHAPMDACLGQQSCGRRGARLGMDGPIARERVAGRTPSKLVQS